MRICVAQTRPIRGNIQSNIDRHKELIELAITCGVNRIIFPELSLTGYEPELAQALAIDQDDPKLDVFQSVSDAGQITIGVGIPTRNQTGICISLVLFQPHQARQNYSKQYLHPDEERFFVAGQPSAGLIGSRKKMAMAICYEISVPEHSENAHKNGAQIYVTSVAKFVNGIDKALNRLSEIARDYSMTVLMANCVGLADGSPCAGKSSVWNCQGTLVGQLNDSDEGLLIWDTETHEIATKVS